MTAGILMGCMHLLVEVELHIAPEVLLAVCLWLLSFCLLRPLVEVGSTILIAIDTELSIRNQPLSVVIVELLVGFGSLHMLPLLFEQLLQVVHLGLEHTLVVNLWQSVQFLAQRLKCSSLSLILNLRQLTEVGVLRMQGIDTDRVIRIAVLPSTRHIGVVNRQYLQDALVGLVHPVNHLLQVAKVTHTK